MSSKGFVTIDHKKINGKYSFCPECKTIINTTNTRKKLPEGAKLVGFCNKCNKLIITYPATNNRTDKETAAFDMAWA